VREQEQREKQMGRESWKFAFQPGELLNWLRACYETITSHRVTSQVSSTQKKTYSSKFHFTKRSNICTLLNYCAATKVKQQLLRIFLHCLGLFNKW